MTWRMPGAKPWVMTTVGLTQTADWEEGSAAGLLKYDDGTLWCWNGEMAHTSMGADYVWSHVVINELVPGAKAWEQLTPDMWLEDDGSDLVTGQTGRLVEDVMQEAHWLVAHDGGDRSFWFGGALFNAAHYQDVGVMVVSRETRTWEYKHILDNFSGWITQPIIWGEYVWFFTRVNDTTNDIHYATLYKMSMESPYAVTEADSWNTSYAGYSTYGPYFEINATTGLPRILSEFNIYEPAVGVDEQYLYVMDWFWDPSNDRGISFVKRMELPDGGWETLYYGWEPTVSEMFSYNLPGGERNDRTVGPMPIGLGLRPNWGFSRLEVRDGWLYYIEASALQVPRVATWTGGQFFCRIRLSDIERGWVQHQPENPIVELLSSTTAAYDSFYNWDENGPYGFYAWEWRDGLNSLHAFPENGWIMDDDGSILFLHHEYPTWLAEPIDYYPPYVISRLSPPENLPITLNFVFEGNEMKGYGHVREVPAKTKIGTIELSGE